MTHELHTTTLRLACDTEAGHLTLYARESGERLLIVPSLALMQPVLPDGGPWVYAGIAQPSTDELRLQFTAEGRSCEVRITACADEDALDLCCTFRSASPTQFNRLDLFPAGTIVTAYDLVNYRNRHHTPATYPELLLGGTGCRTDTYSGDWQFAPHPTLFIFRKAELALFTGFVELPAAFGMFFSAVGHRVESWHVDYGAAPHGQPVSAGETVTSPRFRLFCRQDHSVADMLDVYAAMLIRAGEIPDPSAKRRADWWREPLYCTWIDQHYLARTRGTDKTPAMLDEALIRQAVDVITRERLPFRTILLDEGWQVLRGQWEPHPVRFPDLRRLVDDLHAKGFKVVVWWAWAEVDDRAEVDPAHLIGGGQRNRHGRRMRDYSLPATQRDYLLPLFHRLFSSDPGCYDLDGIKTDYMADKVHPDMPVADPAWRGEEPYFLHLTRLFCTEMKRHKPDAMHIGGAGHFHLAEWIDTNRTFDDFGSNYRIHEERMRMLRHSTPGCPVAYDFHTVLEHLPEYFASARLHGAGVHIGNLLMVCDDPFTPPRPADANYYALLRQWLPQLRGQAFSQRVKKAGRGNSGRRSPD